MTNLRIYELALDQVRDEWHYYKRLGVDGDIVERLWKEVCELQNLVWNEQRKENK